MCSVSVFSADYYWVGGRGVWDATNVNNWATTSGGTTFYNTPPTPTDNVIFDQNSGFTENNNAVEIGAGAYCYDMTWNGAKSKPIIKGLEGEGNIAIYGSLQLQEDLSFISNVKFSFSGTGNHTIRTNACKFISPSGYGISFYFVGTGEWTLMDNLEGKYLWIQFEKGSLNTNRKTVSVSAMRIDSEIRNEAIKLDIRGSLFTATRDFRVSLIRPGQTLTLLAEGSTIITNNLTGGFHSNPLNRVVLRSKYSSTLSANGGKSGNPPFSKPLKIKELVFEKTERRSDIGGWVDVENLTIEKGYQADLGGTEIKVSNRFEANGEPCGEKIDLIGPTYGNNKAILNIATTATVVANGLNLQHIKSVNPLTATLSSDLGGNENITFTTPVSKNFYWIGGEGDWSDKTKWTNNSDGSPMAGGQGVDCLPSEIDDVFFNAYSNFTPTADTVFLDIDANVRNLTWQNAPNNPAFKLKEGAGRKKVSVAGDLYLQPGMSYQIPTLFNSQGPIAKKITTNNSLRGDCYFEFVTDGVWRLQDNLSLESIMVIKKGKLYTGGNSVTVKRIEIQSKGHFDMSGSIVRVNDWEDASDYTTPNVANVITTNATIFIHHISSKNKDGVITGIPWQSRGEFDSNSQWNVYEKIVLSPFFLFDLNESAYDYPTNGRYTHFEANNYKSSGNIKTLIVDFDSYIYSGFSVDNLSIRNGKHRLYSFNEGVKVNKSLVIKGVDDCDKRVLLRGDRYGGRFTIELEPGATTDLSNAEVYLIDSNTELLFRNSIDAGLNGANIKFTAQTVQTYYWVGGQGSWNDLKHWTLKENNRTYPATDVSCLPTPNTHVVFDAQSGFTNGSDTVKIEGEEASCKNFIWKNTTPNPILQSTKELRIYGSFDVTDNLKIIEGERSSKAPRIIFHSSKNENLPVNLSTLQIPTKYEYRGGDYIMPLTFQGAGQWTFNADFNQPNIYLYLYGGTYDFSHRKITIVGLKSEANINLTNTQVIIGTSTMEGHFDKGVYITTDNNITATGIESSSFIFKIKNAQFRYQCWWADCKTKKPKSVVFEGDGKYNNFRGSAKTVDVRTKDFYIRGAHIDTLIVQPGATLNVYGEGAGYGLNVYEKAYLSGVLDCAKTKIINNDYHTTYNANASLIIHGGATEFTNIEMKQIDGTGSHQPITLKESIDLGENKAITISAESATSADYGGLGPDIPTPTYPVTLNTDKFHATPRAKYEWNDGSTDNELIVRKPGAYSVKVTYSNGCVRTDEVLVGKFNSLPTLGCVRIGDNFISGEGYAGSKITATVASATYTAMVQQDNTWKIENLTTPLAANQQFSVVQDINGLASDPVSYTVTVPSGEPQVPTATVIPGPNGSINVNENANYEYSIKKDVWTAQGNYTNLDVGTYTVFARLKNSPKCISSAVFEIKDDTPVITPENITLCMGSTQQFESSIAGGTWSVAETHIATIDRNTGLLTPQGEGRTTVSYTTIYNHTSSTSVSIEDGTSTQPVTLNPEPPSCVVLGDTYTYTFLSEGKEVRAGTLPPWLQLSAGDMMVSPLMDAQTLNLKTVFQMSPMVVDSQGNIYVVGVSMIENAIDPSRGATGFIVKVTKNGNRILYAGSLSSPGERDGALSQALLSPIFYMTIDANDNLYITQGNKVKKIDTQTEMLSTIATTTGVFSQNQFGLVADASGNTYYQESTYSGGASFLNIKKVTPQGQITDHIQNLTAWSRNAFQMDQQGNFYVGISEVGNPRVVKIAPNGTMTTLAGGTEAGLVDGTGENAKFAYISGLTIDELGNLYVVDTRFTQGGIPSFVLRKITPLGVVTTFNDLTFDAIIMSVATDKTDMIVLDAKTMGSNTQLAEPQLKRVLPKSYTIVSETPVPEGTHTYNLSVKSLCREAQKNVTIQAGKPKFTDCPTNQVVEVDKGVTSANVSWTPPTATDFCGGTATLTSTHNPNASFGIGETVVTYTAKDKNNNTSTCSFTVTVKEKAIACKPITGVTAVCVGKTTQLSTTTTGVTWSSTDESIATVDANGFVTGVKAGTVTITYAVGGCSESLVFTVNAKPKFKLIKSDISCFNTTPADGWIEVTATEGKAPLEFLIYKGGLKVKEITGQNLNIPYKFTGLEKGVYNVLVIDANGCVETEYIP